MSRLRTVAAAGGGGGVPSAGLYPILTGAVMLWLAYQLAVGGGGDPAAPFVAVALALVGLWQLERGLRAESRRRRRTPARSQRADH